MLFVCVWGEWWICGCRSWTENVDDESGPCIWGGSGQMS